MRRPICYTESSIALAGERKTWRFVITPSSPLQKKTRLKFDLESKGRLIDWETPQTNLKVKSNLIWAQIEDGKPIQAKEITKDRGVPAFEFELPVAVEEGQNIIISIGTPQDDKESTQGNLSQLTIQRRRPFTVYIDPTGKGKYSDSEVFTLDVRGNTLEAIRILAPSVTIKNRRFDVMLRFEDCYGNLTNNAPEDTIVEFTHENLRESLKWTLFLPETGFIAVPNLYFNEPGTYAICVTNLKTKKKYFSAPIKCFFSEEKSLFWGLFHGESERYDSSENIEDCLRQFRDADSLNFISTSSPDTIEETTNELWKKISTTTAEFDEEDRFSALLGQQWLGSPKKEGMRLFIFHKHDRPILRQSESRFSTLKKVYKMFSPKEFISIPSFTMSSSSGFDFEDFDPEFERVVEIYNSWGSSETTSKKGNPFPISSRLKKGVKEYPEGAVIEALKKNCRVGFVAGGLDDRSIFSACYDGEQQQYHQGLTAVLCNRLTRNTIFEALYNRNCYATTGARIVLGFTVAGHQMGSELSTATKPGLAITRYISGYVAGTTPVETIEILRNGEVLHTYRPKCTSYDFEFDDLNNLHQVSLQNPKGDDLFSFYYIRVTQSDGHMAWSSPIWIDCLKIKKIKGKKG